MGQVKIITGDEFEDSFIWGKINYMAMKKIKRWHDRLNKNEEETNND